MPTQWWAVRSGLIMSTPKDLRDVGGSLTVMRPSVPHLKRGVCYVTFAFELGLTVRLDIAAQRLKQNVERTKFRRNRRAPKYFDYDPPPLRILQHGQQINAGKFFTKPQAELTLFDFGGCSVTYQIDIAGPISHLIELGEVLYDHAYLLQDAHERVRLLMGEIGDAISRPQLSDSVEDFAVYHFEEFDGQPNVSTLLSEGARDFASLLRAEKEELGEEEVRDCLNTRTSYGPNDCAVVDWNGALFFGADVEDVRAVLEFCNVELLEMRFLDEQLDDYLEKAYAALTTGKRSEGDLRKIARLQVDSALLYEAVENALKLLGDQYLARVYTLASTKFHLPEWNSSIRRKLDVLDSIYQKLSDSAARRRSEALEWTIVILILFEILMGLWEKL
jgi:hypothetical protein